MKSALVRTGLIALLGASLGGHAAELSDADLVRLGKLRFHNDCASCHGMSGKGDGPAATSLRKAPSDLTQIARKNDGVFPTDYVARVVDGRGFEILAHGDVEMPVWGQQYRRALAGLSEARVKQRIDSLVAYLKTLQAP
ncbi:MAG: cytochrome c [Gammaproteobacteria bacterium]